jgi:predicted nuclease of predicted toxin-antitoxin system
MRLLIDAALSPLVARKLRDSGYDAVHVRDRGMMDARDNEIVALAERENRIIISADTDFGTLLTLRRQAKPSFILLRHDIENRPHLQAEVLLRELPNLQEPLAAGAIIVITADRIRIRRLTPPAS